MKTDALSFIQAMIAISITEFETIKNFVDASK